jgi:Predicted nucleotide-binding protein containing TIR-like domain
MSKGSRKPLPKVFIGSSAESLEVAYAVQENLEPDAEPTVWPQGVVALSTTTIDSLNKVLSGSDFGIFVFAPDDIIQLRKKTYATVRDNVVFELGLFVGRLGLERTFIVMPKGTRNFRIPTDLSGLTPGLYNAKRQDKNLQAALGPTCTKIRLAMKRLKPINRRKKTKPKAQRTSIQAARYGRPRHWVDVRKELERQLKGGKWRIIAGNSLGGDPAPGTQKQLRLEFSHGGRKYLARIPEGQGFILPK